MSICVDGLITYAAEHWPEQIALVQEDQRMTYRSLEDKVRSLAGTFIRMGLRPKDRVGVLSRNSIQAVVAYFSILRAGAAVVPLNYTLDIDELAWICQDCSPFVIFADSNLKDKADRMASYTKTGKIIFDNSVQDGSGTHQEEPLNAIVSEDDPAFVIYTSGSTGRSLGVMLSHKNLISNSRAVSQYLGLTKTEKACGVLPFYYIYGLSLLLSHFFAGATIFIENRFLYPALVLDAIEKNQMTSFSGVSSHYAILTSQSDFLSRKLPSLRYFSQAGDSMPVSAVNKIASAFPSKKLYLMYGQTEASPRLSYLSPDLVKKKPGSVGKAVPGVELKVVDEGCQGCAVGKEGEIIARGDNVMLGYWNNPAETNKVIKNGWLYTGDIGFKDEDGDVYIIGRVKQFLKIGGHRVNPAEIERVANEFPGVSESAAFGIPDEILGEKIILYIGRIPGFNIDPALLIRHCRGHLAAHKVPAQAIILDMIPKNSYGKIDKKKMIGYHGIKQKI